ncbi:MAG: hypothetical protein QOJ84_703 [Bradyrhizobium sp.]|jgi:LDH2 family malate/lactate/ureidoglycolate dehydrogenase|nr:hypothetical protein [Bradyrhizobium sp.]
MKKPSKAKNASAKKVSKKKVTAKAKAKKAAKKKTVKKTAKKAAKKAKKAAVGCCTLTGSGPDQQFEGITRAECRKRGIAAGKNDHWVAGFCAEPN